MKKNRRFLGAFLFGALVVLAACGLKSVFRMTEPNRIFRVLCDGCFLAAVMLLGVGLLVMIDNNGLFDAFGYSARFIFNLLIPGPGKGKPKESFVEYRQRRHEKPAMYGFLLLSGGFYLLAAFVFLLLFNLAGGAEPLVG